MVENKEIKMVNRIKLMLMHHEGLKLNISRACKQGSYSHTKKYKKKKKATYFTEIIILIETRVN